MRLHKPGQPPDRRAQHAPSDLVIIGVRHAHRNPIRATFYVVLVETPGVAGDESVAVGQDVRKHAVVGVGEDGEDGGREGCARYVDVELCGCVEDWPDVVGVGAGAGEVRGEGAGGVSALVLVCGW